MKLSALFSKSTPTPTKAEIGQSGERQAASYLKKHGYRIVAANKHEGKSEIDIIALKDNTLVFVEVKSRTVSAGNDPLSRPADAVNRAKVTYLIRGANRFLSENSDKYSSFYKRFDIIEVYFERKGSKTVCSDIRHFENAISGG